MFAGTVPPPRKREVDPRHERRPAPPMSYAALDLGEVTVVAKVNWYCDGDMDFKMSPEELDAAVGDARVVFTYPGGRIQLVELRYSYCTHSEVAATHQEVAACWAKRVVVDAGTRGGPDFKWASFTQREYDRLAGKGRVDRWTVYRVGIEIVYDDDYCH